MNARQPWAARAVITDRFKARHGWKILRISVLPDGVHIPTIITFLGVLAAPNCELWRLIALLTRNTPPHIVGRFRLGGILGRAHSSAVEHLTFNQRADGSTPSGLTIPSSRLLKTVAARPTGVDRATSFIAGSTIPFGE
jgi:hypothetical protein